MAATAELKLTGSAEISQSSGTQLNNPAVATFAAVAGKKNYVQKAIISASGTIAAAVRATITYTFGGVAQTIGIQIGVNFTNTGVVCLDFGNNPIEGDDNTAITLTIPALGAAGNGEAVLMGLQRLT